MTIQATTTQIVRQFKVNWLRMVIASAGILIGVWSIALTSSLSFSISDVVTNGINSQASAKNISLQKKSNGATTDDNLAEIPTSNTAVSLQEVATITQDLDSIDTFYPTISTSGIIQNPSNPKNCLELQTRIVLASTESPNQATNQNLQKNFEQNCQSVNITYDPLFTYTDGENKSKWYGQLNKLEKGEIAVCFECSSQDPLYQKLKASNPNNMLGKTISIEYLAPPAIVKSGQEVEFFGEKQGSAFTTQRVIEYTIAAVLDDREVDSNLFSGSNNFVYGAVEDYIEITKPVSNIPSNQVGFDQYTVTANSYEQVPELIEQLKNKGYNASSPSLTIINAIRQVFLGVSIILGLFGFVALVASMFGIVNVMTIAVLKRKKEIGIIKALGARSRDIFVIFILESLVLGVLGWIFGILLTLFTFKLIAFGFDKVVLSNDSWKSALENFDITSFEPTLYWQVALITLALALLFTTVSGLIPAIRAAKQQPVDVLR